MKPKRITELTEISGLKNTIKKLKQKINKLDAQYFQLKNLIEMLPGDIYWKDTKGIWLGMNKRCAKSLQQMGFIQNIDVSEMTGKTDYDVFEKHTADGYRKTDLKVMNEKIEISTEEKTQLPSGETVTLLSTKIPLFDKAGDVRGIVGNTVDISYLKKIESSLSKALKMAESANQTKTEFIANMSHDIRTPLTGVVGMAELIEDITTDSQQKQYAHLLGKSGHQLLNMLNSILDVVSADNANESDLHEHSLNIKSLINDLIELERPTIILKGLNLVTEIDEALPQSVIADGARIHRVLLNLLGNAIKFTSSGQIIVKSFLLKQGNNTAHVRFKVSDTGHGIDEALQEKVFDRFFRASPSYQGLYTGHGVGLHIAESYTKLLGGRISFESKLNVGTTFTVDLPLKIDNKSIDRNIESIASEPILLTNPPIIDPGKTQVCVEVNKKNNAQLGKPVWLLIEDNPTALMMLSHMVEQHGITYSTAVSAEEGLMLAKQHPFQLIITDLGLPNMSGIGFTQIFRQYELENHQLPTPIIGLTAHADSQIKQDCVDAGMNEAYTKPMTTSILKTILSSFDHTNALNHIEPNLISLYDPEKSTLGLDLPQTEPELFQLTHKSLLDPQSALKELGHNVTLFNTILKQMIEQDLPHDLNELRTAYKRGDWDKIEHTAHRMKGGFIYCGMTRLSLACQYLERYRKAGQSRQLDALFYQVIEISDATMTSIKKWLAMQT